jgi:hypothetical protein
LACCRYYMTGRARAVPGPANSCGNLDYIVDLDPP